MLQDDAEQMPETLKDEPRHVLPFTAPSCVIHATFDFIIHFLEVSFRSGTSDAQQLHANIDLSGTIGKLLVM